MYNKDATISTKGSSLLAFGIAECQINMYQVIIALQQMRENFKSIAIVTAGGCLINKMCWYMCIFFFKC